MKPPLQYGLILAATNIVYTLVGFLLGFQSDKIADATVFGLLFYPILIVILWLGIRAVREGAADKSMSYGKGVGSGVLISLYGSVVSSIYGFVHFTFINPNFGEYMMDLMHKKWAAAGMSDAQIDAASKFMKFSFNPAMMSVMGVIYTVIIGLLIALIVAAILKRAPQPVPAEAPPAA